MMNTFKFVMEIGTREYCKATEIDYSKTFYKNGTPKNQGIINIIWQLSRDIRELQEKEDLELIDIWQKATIKINQQNILVTFNWEKMDFDRHSSYENVYDFMHFFKHDKLDPIWQFLLNKYDLITWFQN